MSVTVTEPTIAERVDMLRMLMTARGVDVYVIPSPDPHQNEYVPDIWQRRTWISGFDGSAGTAVVTANKAYVWTDSRYWLQADRQLADTPFEVMRQGQPDVPSPEDWLESNLMDGSAVGLDPQIFTLKSWRSWEEKIQRGGSRIVELEGNLVDEIWKARPQFPKEPLLALSTEFSGKSVEDKLADLRKDLARARCNAHILTKLDSIAWLFNIRGNDVEHNPLPLSYAIVTGSDAQLFIDPDKVTPEVKEHFGTTVTVRSYGEFGMELEALNQKLAKVWVDPATVSRWIVNRLTDDSAGAGGGATIYERESPVVLAKALKNEVELEGMRRCHVRDGAAVCKFLRWLDETIAAGKTPDEIEVADQLESYRKQGEHFKGLSFRTISGYGPNGAVVHYTVTPDTALRLEQGSLYLVDSGASVPGRHHRHHAHGAARRADRRAEGSLHPGAEGSHRDRHGSVPGRHARWADRRARAPAALGDRAQLRPWHWPRRRSLPLRARGTAGDRAALRSRQAGAGDDPVQRARLLQGR